MTESSLAADLLRRAAEQGHAEAQNRLGTMYAQGQGVPQDHVEAARWYRLAADQGLADAQFNLGVMYDKELTIEMLQDGIREIRKALSRGEKLLERAASAGITFGLSKVVEVTPERIKLLDDELAAFESEIETKAKS